MKSHGVEPVEVTERGLPIPGTGHAKIRLLIVDDQPLMREQLRRIVQEEPDMIVVGEAADGSMGVTMARTLRPDMILMDVNMPVLNGFAATRQIKEELPHIVIIGLSFHTDAEIALAMRKAGADAYMSKASLLESLCETIRQGGRKANQTR
ncbi:response regulator [Candidatus Nitrospira bockiana]